MRDGPRSSSTDGHIHTVVVCKPLAHGLWPSRKLAVSRALSSPLRASPLAASSHTSCEIVWLRFQGDGISGLCRVVSM